MNTDEIAFTACAYLLEGDQREALKLLLGCLITINPPHWTNDETFGKMYHGPNVALGCSRATLEILRDYDNDLAQQILAAFQAAMPNEAVTITPHYVALRPKTEPWRQQAIKELPGFESIDAEFTDQS